MFFRAPPSPPPLPPPPPLPLLGGYVAWAVGSALGLVLTLPGLLSVSAGGAYYIRRRVNQLSANAFDKAFEKVDANSNGRITAEELYIGVCECYLLLHECGLNVRAPKKDNVLKLLKIFDIDGSGELNREEFVLLMQRLLKAQAGRIFSQISLTVLCPITASYVCAVLHDGFRQAATAMQVDLPAIETVPLLAKLPSTLDETIVCGAMMLSISPILAFVDRLAEKPQDAVRMKYN